MDAAERLTEGLGRVSQAAVAQGRREWKLQSRRHLTPLAIAGGKRRETFRLRSGNGSYWRASDSDGEAAKDRLLVKPCGHLRRTEERKRNHILSDLCWQALPHGFAVYWRRFSHQKCETMNVERTRRSRKLATNLNFVTILSDQNTDACAKRKTLSSMRATLSATERRN